MNHRTAKRVKRYGKRLRKRVKRAAKRLNKRAYYPVYVLFLSIFAFALAFPDSFGGFIWQYYWGPVVADAAGHSVAGISEGYNPVSSVTYGILLILSLYLIYLLFKRRKVVLDRSLMLALSPLIISGAVARVLEDASVFGIPSAYLFISPIIYLWLGALGLFLVLYSEFLERRGRFEAMVLCSLPYFIILRFLWFMVKTSRIPEDPAYFLPVTGIFFVLHIYFVKKREYEMSSSVFLYSMYVLSVFSFYAVMRFGTVRYPMELVLIPSIAALVSAAVYVLARFLDGYMENAHIFLRPENLAIIFAHSLDGGATWTGMSFFGYGEKHVLPSIMIAHTGSALLFLLSKVILALVAVYLLDVSFKRYMKNQNIAGLTKFTIIVLGLGPGIRDMLRIALHV